MLDAQREVLIFKAPEHEALKVLLLNRGYWGQEDIPLYRGDPYRLTITRVYRTGEVSLEVVKGGSGSLEERAELTWKAYQDRLKVSVPRRALLWAASEFVFCLRSDRMDEVGGASWYPTVELPPVEKPKLRKKS
jgi:hypothetical protein